MNHPNETDIIAKLGEDIYQLMDKAYGVDQAQIIGPMIGFKLKDGTAVTVKVSTLAPPKPFYEQDTVLDV